MRVLITTPYPVWPESSGAARRTLGIARALSARGHEVTVLAAAGRPPRPGGRREPFRLRSYSARGRAGHFVNQLFSRALDAALRKGQDLVLASFPYQAYPLARFCRHHRTPLVYDAHNVEAERFASLGSPV
ncbi:MAG: glycosyltransferase, partial [Chromatiales bacterium]